jgi:thioredoxin-like negative regulator of GroEL
MTFQAENFILDPMDYISNLFTSGQMEKLQSEVIRLISDPDYSFFPFEKKFDQAGHMMLKGGRLQEAQAVFGLTTQLFPESANTWHSLAAVMLKMGEKDQAKALLQKVAQMAPNEAAGKSAKEQLQELGMD